MQVTRMKSLFFIVLALVSTSTACYVTNVYVDCDVRCINFLKDSNGCTICQCDDNNNSVDDMHLTSQTADYIRARLGNNEGYNDPIRGASTKLPKWTGVTDPSGNVIIPYSLAGTMSFNGLVAVLNAITDFHTHTCVRFVPRSYEVDYMYFVGNETGCWAYLGKISGPNTISIGSGCETKGVVQHEIMHSLGFFHEHSRPDRDSYIQVHMDNVNTNMQTNFWKINDIDSFGSPYDYTSIMHYPGDAFSNNEQDTITMADGTDLFGYQRDGLAVTDIEQINTMYGCTGYTVGTTAAASTAVPTTDISTNVPNTVASTNAPSTALPTTDQTTTDSTSAASTPVITTAVPTTDTSTTASGTTAAPTTAVTTAVASTAAPTSVVTTGVPTSVASTVIPTTASVTTAAPTTVISTTASGTTAAPTTAVTTAVPSTAAPTTVVTTGVPTTVTSTAIPTTAIDTTISETTVTTAATSATTLPSCRDLLLDCPSRASQGLCSFPGEQKFMKRNCKKSCGRCKECVDKSGNCANLLSFCTSKGVRKNCRNSCNACK